jgi:hypothetical protein
MTGQRVEKFGHSKLCVHCNQIEDEVHAFIACIHIQPVWLWFNTLIQKVYLEVNFQSMDTPTRLVGFHEMIIKPKIRPWKLLHSETLRAIIMACTESKTSKIEL